MRVRNGKNLVVAVLCALTALVLSVGSAAYALPIPDPGKLPAMVTVAIRSGTEMGFNWNTSDYTASDLEVVEAGGAFDGENVLRFTGEVALSKAHKDDGYIHRAAASGLETGTEYLYRVGDAEFGTWQEGSFTTPKKEGAFTFVHLSDPQGWEEKHYDTYNDLLKSAVDENTAFIAATGDIVNNSWADREPVLEQWTWALTKQVDILKDVPFMAVAGNHDAADHDFNARFNYASAGDGRTGDYYSFDYAGVHFIALNTNDTSNKDTPEATGLSDAQMTWLESDLEANESAAWKIVLMHKGIFDAGGHSSNLEEGSDYDIARIREQLAPLFTQHGVDLVLQGHDHLYSRTVPVSAAYDGAALTVEAGGKADTTGTYRDRQYELYARPQGAVYFNTGSASGSKYYEAVSYDPAVIPIDETAAPKSPMYTAFRIDGGSLFADTYLVENGQSVPFKSFGIYKSDTVEDTLTLASQETPDGQDDPAKDVFPVWAIVLIAVGGVLILGGTGAGVWFMLKRKRGGARK